MKDVAVPLYRFFLADAHAAARAGDSARMLECVGLALDFVPASQRESVLVTAAELAPPVSWSASGASSRSAPTPRVIVEIAREAPPPMPRIAWEHRVASPVVPRMHVPPPAQPSPAVGVARRSWSARVAGILLLAVAGIGTLAVLGRDGSYGILSDPVARASGAVSAGDPARALQLLEPLGLEAPSAAWLIRASAYEAMSDRVAAIRALEVAAARDSDGGASALEAGDRLVLLGAVREAADAYLFAVTPARSAAEVQRIARVQELAGYPERAKRIRQR